MRAPIRVLHALHDYLPRHQAGSELYVAHLCAAQRHSGDHPAVLAADFDAADAHGRLRWRTHDGVPVAELVNTWQFGSFSATYQDALIGAATAHALDILQPQILHIHNLLNLTFTLPALAHARGIPVVATLHDHTLVCPSGGQRLHRRDSHVCRTIDTTRCARCFAESPFHAQWRVGRIAARTPGRWAGRAARVARRLVPLAAQGMGGLLGALPGSSVDAAAIEQRLGAAREAFAACDVVVAPSASLAREFAALGFPGNRMVVSDYGFPPLAATPRVAPPDGRLRVGFLGTLVWHKGADVLVEAARCLGDDRVVVQIHGDLSVFPDYSSQLLRRAEGLPVVFGGRVEHHRVAEVLRDMDVVVVPSRWLENSPLVIHEAFQAGVPVIGAAIGGIVDLLASGGGVTVAPDDAPALARAIAGLLDDPSRLEALRASIPPIKSIDQDAAEWRQRYEHLLRPRADAAAC
jgi:glycosyltransferase involved in cell wall biosynthesis